MGRGTSGGTKKETTGLGDGVKAESPKQNRNKLHMENAVALHQNPVDFGSDGRSGFQLQLFSFAFCHVNLAWGLAAMETAGWVESVGVKSCKPFLHRKSMLCLERKSETR